MTKKAAGGLVVEKIAISVTGSASSQSASMRATVRVGTTMLRLTVKPDRSYYEQGHAAIEVWTPAGWAQVHHIPGECVASRKRDRAGTDFGPADFKADAAELLRVAFVVLAIDCEPSTGWVA